MHLQTYAPQAGPLGTCHLPSSSHVCVPVCFVIVIPLTREREFVNTVSVLSRSFSKSPMLGNIFSNYVLIDSYPLSHVILLISVRPADGNRAYAIYSYLSLRIHDVSKHFGGFPDSLWKLPILYLDFLFCV